MLNCILFFRDFVRAGNAYFDQKECRRHFGISRALTNSFGSPAIFYDILIRALVVASVKMVRLHYSTGDLWPSPTTSQPQSPIHTSLSAIWLRTLFICQVSRLNSNWDCAKYWYLLLFIHLFQWLPKKSPKQQANSNVPKLLGWLSNPGTSPSI